MSRLSACRRVQTHKCAHHASLSFLRLYLPPLERQLYKELQAGLLSHKWHVSNTCIWFIGVPDALARNCNSANVTNEQILVHYASPGDQISFLIQNIRLNVLQPPDGLDVAIYIRKSLDHRFQLCLLVSPVASTAPIPHQWQPPYTKHKPMSLWQLRQCFKHANKY